MDEYQDTNKLQGALIDLLAANHHNVMAVGDDCQSIYSWRGAHFQNILKFPDRHPGAKIYRIETNYRSTPEILRVANAAIAANVRQFPKELAAARPGGVKPVLVACGDGNQQAAFIAQRVLQLREEGIGLNKMAVLYRAHFHALELQFELTRRNIPFSITSGLRFCEQAHIKDVAAWLKFITNPRDEPAFKRIVRLLPGVGARSADKMWNAFRAAPPAGKPPLAAALQKIAAAVPKKSAVALGAVHRHHRPVGGTGDPPERLPHDPSGAGSRLRRLFARAVHQLPVAFERPGADGRHQPAICHRGGIPHPTGPANQRRSRGQPAGPR